MIDKIQETDISYEINDERQTGRSIKVTFKGQLREEQKPALVEMIKYDNGILHAASDTIASVLKNVKAKYVYGVTATPKRADGLEKINYMLIGPIRYSYTAKEKAKEQRIPHLVYPRFTVATGSLVDEGFDFPRLDTLIMATPVSFRSVVEQYAGRLNRDYERKRNVIIYDYIDSHIPMFDKMYAKRLKAYRQIGYEICSGLHCEKQSANAIFDGENYKEVFKKDLLEADKRIVISSPVISGAKVYELIDMSVGKRKNRGQHHAYKR